MTGGYYSGTAKAVKAYQKDNGIYPSGEATVETQESLFAEALAKSTPTPEPTPEATPLPTAETTPSPAPEE